MAERTLRTWAAVIVCLLICFAPGIVGSRFGPDDWYRGLTRPRLTPPGWLFPVVWNVLYLLMGVALFKVWRGRGRPGAAAAMAVFGAQLVLNGLWTWIFFGLHRPGWALVDLSALWLLVAAAMIVFWRVRTSAGLLLLPYLAWLTFAGYLNFEFWRLN